MTITKIPIIQITKNGTIIEVNPTTTINNIGVSSGTLKLDTSIVNQELSFGELYSSQFSVQLFNIDDNLEGCDIQLFLEEDGVRTSKFKGIIESSKRDNIGGYRDIIAYDWIYYHRDDDISTWWNSFWVSTRTGATIQEIRQSLITYIGFTNDSNTYINDSISIPNNFNFYTDLKLSVILKMICELQAIIPHIDENGNLEFISFSNTTSNLTDKYEGSNSKWEDYTTEAITGIGFYSTSNDLSQLVGTNANVYNISGNLFALVLNATTLTTLGTNILNAINNIQFVPSKIKMITTNFDLVLGQRVSTPKGYSYVMTNSLSGGCLIEQTIECKQSSSTLSQRVDSKNDTLIEGAKMSKFEQTIDGFTTEVQRIDNVANSANTNASTALNNSNRAIVTDTLHYLATSLSSGVTTSTSGWTTTTQSVTSTNKYLWTYHTYTYASGSTADTTPVISGVYGDTGSQGATGTGISEVVTLYYASNSSTVPTAPTSEITTTVDTTYNIWTKGIPALTSTYQYLYTCDQVKYTNNTFTWTTSVLNKAITTSSSEVRQLADQIVLKVKTDGTVAQVALDSSAETGSNVLIKGNNIQLDGDVTITSGFVLNAGVIRSSNYVYDLDTDSGFSDTGTELNLTNGSLITPYIKINSNGLYALGDITIRNGLYAYLYTGLVGPSWNLYNSPIITIGQSQLYPEDILGNEVYRFHDTNRNIVFETADPSILFVGGTPRIHFENINVKTFIRADYFNTDKVLVSDANNHIVTSAVTSTELGYLDGVTSAIQTQLNNKLALSGGTLTGNLAISKSGPVFQLKNTNVTIDKSSTNGMTGSTTIGNIGYYDNAGNWTGRIYNYGNAAGSIFTQLSARNMKTDGTWVSNYIQVNVAKDGTQSYSVANAAGFRSAIGAQATITGGATTLTENNLTASRALISNSSGKVAVSAVTSTELGYLDGVTSAIQTQLNNKLAKSGIVVSHTSVTVTKTAGSSADVTAPTVSGYTFICWIAFATNGWVAPVYKADPTSKTGKIYVASAPGYTGSGSTGTVDCYALYRTS